MTDPTMAPGSIVCRLLQEGDQAGVSRLWQSETPWGQPSSELIEWFGRNPAQGSFVAVAEDERGEIVGQIVAAASRVCVDGREVLAIRQFAPIVSRAARERATDLRENPVLNLVRVVFRCEKEAGV